MVILLSRAKRYSDTEIARISKNFIYITQKCPLSKTELAVEIVSKNTYDKLYNSKRFPDWCPQEKVLRKIVNYFNQYFLPSITLQDLINNSLENMNFIPKEEEKLSWYAGIYLCYYLNFSGKHCNLGILRIYHSDDLDYYNCEAIMGLEEEQYESLKKMLGIFNIEHSLESVYNNYINKSSNAQEFQDISHIQCTYFLGNAILSSHSVTLSLTNQKNSFLRIITLKRCDGVNTAHYQGGIGSMLTTPSYDKPTIFKNIGFSSTVVDIHENLEKMKELLKISVENFDTGVISNDNVKTNKLWFKLIREEKRKLLQNNIT